MLNPNAQLKKLNHFKNNYSIGKKKILLVDSCPLIAKRIDLLIAKLKHTTLGCVHDIYTLERRISSNAPDLIIINIATKGELDGYQIAKVLKLDYEIPFCILYDEKATSLKKWAEELNPDSFISYSSNEDELLSQLELALY